MLRSVNSSHTLYTVHSSRYGSTAVRFENIRKLHATFTYGPWFIAPWSAITPHPLAHVLPSTNPGLVTGESADERIGGMVRYGHQLPHFPVVWCAVPTEPMSFMPGLLLRIVLVTTFILGKISPPSGAVWCKSVLEYGGCYLVNFWFYANFT